MDSPTYTADAVRAELARKRRTRADLASALEMTPYTLGRRLSGKTPFTIPEIVAASVFLGVPLATFIPPDGLTTAAVS
jgi:transcriptional regulator with XRE-family HTH domain